MAAECMVIALIIIAIFLCFFKTKRKKWAYSTLPLMVLPLANGVLSLFFTIVLKTEVTLYCAFITIIVSMIAACIWIGICSMTMITGRRTRIPYLGVTILFNLLLAIILLNHYYNLAAPIAA